MPERASAEARFDERSRQTMCLATCDQTLGSLNAGTDTHGVFGTTATVPGTYTHQAWEGSIDAAIDEVAKHNGVTGNRVLLLSSSGVPIATPDRMSVAAAKGVNVTIIAASEAVSSFAHKKKFILTDELTGLAPASRPYTTKHPDGKVTEGVTNKMGETLFNKDQIAQG
jgi:hypothetical protein